MSEDPFARFERSRGGWLIPVVLFVLGAVPTTVAIRELHNRATMQPLEEQADGNEAGAGDAVEDADLQEGNDNE